MCTAALQEAARLLRDRALDALKAAAVSQAESAQLRAQLMLSQPSRGITSQEAEVGPIHGLACHSISRDFNMRSQRVSPW